VLAVAIVFGTLGPGTDDAVALRYKELARGIAVVWAVGLLLPVVRRALPHRATASDGPLVLFALAAVLSVAFGEGHWGDVRSLFAAIVLGWLGRTLFDPPARRGLFLHYLGGVMLLILARELVAHPDLLPPREALRYTLVTANANPLGFLFAMAAPLCLAEALAGTRGRRLAGAVYFVAAVTGVLVTLSRSAALGLAIGTLPLVLTARTRRLALLCGAIGVVLFLALQRPDVWSHERRQGDVDRLKIVRTSLSLAAERPLLGLGFGINNLRDRFPQRFEALYGEPLFRSHSANQLVDLLVGTGVIGTALACWWVALLVRTARRQLREAAPGPARVRATGNAAALAAILAMSLLEPPLYHGKLLPLLFLELAYLGLAPAGEPSLSAKAPPA
jgi:hypothetical protein